MDGSRVEHHMRREEWDDAIFACQTVLQLQPTNARVLGCLGMCHFRKGEYESAAQAFRRATILDEKFVDAGVRLAQCYDRLRRFQEAYDTAQEFLRVQPNNVVLQAIVDAHRDRPGVGPHDSWERSAGATLTHVSHVD